MPGKKAADLRRWLTIYAYWNQGGVVNVQSMVLYLVDQLVAPLPPATTTSGPAGAAPGDVMGGGMVHIRTNSKHTRIYARSRHWSKTYRP